MKCLTACLVVLMLAVRGTTAWADAPSTQPMPLWSADELTPKAEAGSEKTTSPRDIGRWVTGVTEPTIAVLTPPGESGPRTAVVICPGGGYGGLALDWEGYDVAKWLNKIGVTGIVLKYRMPKPEITKDGKPLPFLDAQQAMRMVRQHASEWNIDPNRIGIAGFSAGGHLASTMGTHFEFRENSDRQQISDRPDFMILVYPVITFAPIGHTGSKQNLLGKDPDEKMVDLYSNEKHVSDRTPPTFLAHAEDDPVKCENSLYFFEALRAHKVPCELRLFVTGGHGFGIGQRGGEPAVWPKECEAWMKRNHLLGHATTQKLRQ